MTDNNNNPQVIISMTSFPAAITIAEQAIRSLLKGSVLPDKLILYVTLAQFAENEMPQSRLPRRTPYSRYATTTATYARTANSFRL